MHLTIYTAPSWSDAWGLLRRMCGANSLTKANTCKDALSLCGHIIIDFKQDEGKLHEALINYVWGIDNDLASWLDETTVSELLELTFQREFYGVARSDLPSQIDELLQTDEFMSWYESRFTYYMPVVFNTSLVKEMAEWRQTLLSLNQKLLTKLCQIVKLQSSSSWQLVKRFTKLKQEVQHLWRSIMSHEIEPLPDKYIKEWIKGSLFALMSK